MSYLSFVLLNCLLFLLQLYNSNIFVVFVLIGIYLIFYFGVIVPQNKIWKKRYEAFSFIKYASKYYYLNDESLVISYLFLSNESELVIKDKESDFDKIEALDKYYEYFPFSVFVEILKSNQERYAKEKLLLFIEQYSLYDLNLDNLNDNKKEISKIMKMILFSNIIFLIINILFSVSNDGINYLLILVFVFQMMIIFSVINKFYVYQRNIYHSLIEYLIFSCYLSSNISMEKMMINLPSIYVQEFKELIKSYEKNDFYPTMVLIKKYSNDVIFAEVLNVMYCFSVFNNINRVSYVENLILKLTKVNKYDYSFVKSLVYDLFFVGILSFIYCILVSYGTF